MGSRGLNKLAKIKHSTEFESRTHFSRENAHSMGVSDAPSLSSKLEAGFQRENVGGTIFSILSMNDTIKHSLINS